jgi:glutathione S-transferase
MLHQAESRLPYNRAPRRKEFAEMSKKVAGTSKTAGKAKAVAPGKTVGKARSVAPGKTAGKAERVATGKTTITLSSKNYSSWSLRGWLLARFSGLKFEEVMISPDDPDARAEILLLSPSILVPCLTHEGVKIWDTLAIAEYLNEAMPAAGLLPAERAARARCRSICGEMHSGFSTLRASLPMNLKAHFPGFKIWSRAQADIERIASLWRECLATYGGPFLFGKPSMADAMYAPVVTRFRTYDVKLDAICSAYCDHIMKLPAMQEWIRAAKEEAESIDELDVEF